RPPAMIEEASAVPRRRIRVCVLTAATAREPTIDPGSEAGARLLSAPGPGDGSERLAPGDSTIECRASHRAAERAPTPVGRGNRESERRANIERTEGHEHLRPREHPQRPAGRAQWAWGMTRTP